MDAKQFQEIFGRFDHPVLLRTDGGWLTNPAAQALALTQTDLEQLSQWGGDASLWLARQFYHVSASRLDGSVLLILQPDVFLSSAAENIAGQLRDRLSSAFGAATALSENDALRHDLRAREQLSSINRELYRIFRMVTQLERCGPSNPMTNRMGQVDMVRWFDRLSAEVEALCGEAGVKFSADSDVKALSMLANRRQLDYMVLSLISNALKSAPEKDGRITFSMKSQGDQVILTVADNAGGFSPDYLTHPLWSEPQRMLPGRGLGLGLPLVQRIAADHDGALMVFPSQKGTRVVVSLPIRRDDDLFAQPELPIEDAPGFSLAKIVLSDALPRSAYFPNTQGDDE